MTYSSLPFNQQEGKIMAFKYKLTDVLKNTSIGVVPVSHLERIKIFGEIHDDIAPIDEFTFIIKDDKLVITTDANQNGEILAQCNLATGWGEKFIKYIENQFESEDGYFDFNYGNDSYKAHSINKESGKTTIQFYVECSGEYLDFDGLIELMIELITQH